MKRESKYVYTLAYPACQGGRVFYVGRGSGKRVEEHEALARSGDNSEKSIIIRGIWQTGEQVVKSLVFHSNDGKEVHRQEQLLIAFYGLENLTNRVVSKSAGVSSTGAYRKSSRPERQMLEEFKRECQRRLQASLDRSAKQRKAENL